MAMSKFLSAADGWQETLFAFNGWENICVCGFHGKNIHGHTAEVILRLRLTVHIQKLKYKLNSMKYKSLEYKSTFY